MLRCRRAAYRTRVINEDIDAAVKTERLPENGFETFFLAQIGGDLLGFAAKFANNIHGLVAVRRGYRHDRCTRFREADRDRLPDASGRSGYERCLARQTKAH